MVLGICQVAENNLQADEKGHWKRGEVVICIYIYTIDLFIKQRLFMCATTYPIIHNQSYLFNFQPKFEEKN